MCSEPIAAIPYYMESISVNLYSIEELCYYIINHTYLIDKDFMCEELCSWLEQQLGLSQLVRRLRGIMEKKAGLSEFVYQIAAASGYCTMEELEGVRCILQQMEKKSDFECRKIRADKYMENRKYLSSIYEYRRLLEIEENSSQEQVLMGNIWHNLGCAYARLFLFEEAVVCYKNAYRLNYHTQSLKECLFAYRCMQDESGFEELAQREHLDAMFLLEITNELQMAEKSGEIKEFEQELYNLGQSLGTNRREYYREISKIILEWKEDYRRISKL